MGILRSIKKRMVQGINVLGISSKFIGSPKGIITAKQWIKKNTNDSKASFIPIYSASINNTRKPFATVHPLHKLFRNLDTWTQPESFVAVFPDARVWGRNGAVITRDDLLLGDVSREFGKYGGVFEKEHSIFSRLRLGKPQKLKGTIAVVAGSGSYNYHHWMYDVIPRLHLLKQSGLWNKIDFFIIDYTEIKFQKESLEVLGVDLTRIIRCNDNWNFHIVAELLIVPSLPSHLGTISSWVVSFLREAFLPKQNDLVNEERNLYISRKKAPSRKLLNETEVFTALESLDVKEILAEDYSIKETASLFNKASFIIGVHGSGLSNLAFCKEGVRVVDIVAPRHIDPYYWLLTDYSRGVYGYTYGEGERPEDELDLVKNKIDKDITVNIGDLQYLLTQLTL